MDKKKIEAAVTMLLEAVGENPQREGLKETPRRVAAMYEEIFSGLGRDPSQCINVFFEAHSDDPVAVCDIPFYSLCEHHLLPFFGTASILYLPKNRKITGLSKLARLVDSLARQPQVQENLTSQIADTLMKTLEPQGVLVLVKGEHLCLSMRGIKKPGTQTLSVAARGIYAEDRGLKAEALNLLSQTTK